MQHDRSLAGRISPVPSRRQWIASTAGAVLACPLLARQTPTFSTEVKVVNVFATVRNKEGRIIRTLTKEDFTVLENGKPQSIRYFSQESDLPLAIGLLVDTSLSQTRVLENERGASYRFLQQVLRPEKDKAAVVQFDQAVVIRVGLTNSCKDLEDTLALLDSPNAQEAANGSGTLLYDAVRAAAIQLMRQQGGRKAFIVLTDGVDVGSTVTLTDAIESAQRANTLVYCILFSDESYYGGAFGSGGKGALERLSKETGGRFFAVTKAQNIEPIYEAIQEELRSEYSLGFVSNQSVTASGFRKLKLEARQKGLLVQATNRYYAET
jgi:VWFA-related protein